MLVSIVIAAYNAEKYLAKTLDSCLAQTYQEIEIIIVNDGSKDETYNILEIYHRQDSRIKVIHKENQGVGAARNLGNEVAQGAWIAVMDADDVMLPNRIEKQVDFIKNRPEVDVVATWVHYINEKDKVTGLLDLPNDLNSIEDNQRYLRENKDVAIIHPSAMYRKSTFIKTGGYRNIRPSQDTDLWLRMIEQGAIFAVIHEPLTQYRISQESVVISQTLKQRYNYQWTRHNMLRRRSGQPEISKEDFMKKITRSPFGKNFAIHKEVFYRHFLKKATLARSRKKILPLFFFTSCLFLINPRKTYNKIIIQRNKQKEHPFLN